MVEKPSQPEEEEFIVTQEEIIFLKAMRAQGRKVNACRHCGARLEDGDTSGICEKCDDEMAH
jgi:hypothetical protein